MVGIVIEIANASNNCISDMHGRCTDDDLEVKYYTEK